jgi:eukaryotic-like serine/threonine-protein kinase
MTPERWQEVERLYHATLERDGKARAAFLEDACRGDEGLRHEVESLLAYEWEAKDFIETPAGRDLRAPIAAALRRHKMAVPGECVGRVFAVYELKSWIAAGGMGEVYRAIDTRLNRSVAVKILPEHLSNDPDRRQRFRREAKIISSLNHPHICTLYDIGVQAGVDYLVMEYIDGQTLQKRLAGGPLPLTRAIEYAIQIVDALDKAHRCGVIHRDLKPANIMLTASGVKLLDFGLATRLTTTGTGSQSAEHPERLSGERTVMGTPEYCSPEQLQGKPVDARTDIFSFGATAFEMITGQRAFPGVSTGAVVSAFLD